VTGGKSYPQVNEYEFFINRRVIHNTVLPLVAALIRAIVWSL